MNRNRGIWIVIGSILVIGVLVTLATTSFIKSKESTPDALGNQILSSSELSSDIEDGQYYSKEQELFSADNKTSGEQTQLPEEKVMPKKAARSMPEAGNSVTEQSAPASDPQLQMKIADSQEQTDTVPQAASEVPAEESVQETVMSPKAPDTKFKYSNAPAPSEGAAYYQKHLESLDEQIKKIREESGDSNTYSMKALADKELKLWNLEQNTIYETIAQQLSEEDKKSLEASQQAWIKSRDAKAEEAAKKYSGGSLEGLEYIASLAESTRARAYDLVKEYMDVLSTADSQ
jgi:uncharacterized protein YecT (DUF1311 family)